VGPRKAKISISLNKKRERRTFGGESQKREKTFGGEGWGQSLGEEGLDVGVKRCVFPSNEKEKKRGEHEGTHQFRWGCEYIQLERRQKSLIGADQGTANLVGVQGSAGGFHIHTSPGPKRKKGRLGGTQCTVPTIIGKKSIRETTFGEFESHITAP